MPSLNPCITARRCEAARSTRACHCAATTSTPVSIDSRSMNGLLWDLGRKFGHGGPRVNGDCAVRPVPDAIRECGQRGTGEHCAPARPYARVRRGRFPAIAIFTTLAALGFLTSTGTEIMAQTASPDIVREL